MKLQRFDVPGLAHYSYIVSDSGVAAVVDPKREVESYLDYAAKNSLRITHILETHIHADYASGARELAERSGAELWLSGHDRGEDFEYQFPHHEFHDGEELHLGKIKITALHTPGHTPEHLSFLIFDPTRKEDAPVAMLSGDFVFVGSLGRPDLLGEAAKAKLAGELYQSVHERIAALSDSVEVYPAHGAGSMCGAGMGEQPQSTLGQERRSNQFFLLNDRNRFVKTIIESAPPFPDYYRRMKKINSSGPKILNGIPGGAAIAAEKFRELVRSEGAVVLDLRRPESFGGAHVPNSYNIGMGNLLPVWAAWVLPYDQPIYLVAEEEADLQEARLALIRVGLDDVRGHLQGGFASWVKEGHAQSHVRQVCVTELSSMMYRQPVIVDVRAASEWKSGHIEGALHIMGGDLPKRTRELPLDEVIYLICGSGYRSSIAASVLARAGFRKLVNVLGGMSAWTKQGLPVSHSTGAFAVR